MQESFNIKLNRPGFLALLVFGFLALDLLLCAGSLIFGYSIGLWQMPIALIMTVSFGVIVRKYSITGLFLLIFIGSLLLSYFTFDTTFDSISYHKPAIVFLSQGWNPIYENNLDASLWIIHYARALEIMAASGVACGLDIEASKFINLVFLVGVWCIAYNAIKNVFEKLSKKQLVIVTSVLVLNPVVLGQLFTFYNDLYLYMEIIALVAVLTLSISEYKDRRKDYVYMFMLFAITILSVNTKFTHFFFCGLVWLSVWCYFIVKKRYNLFFKYFIVGAVSFIIAVFWVGYSPYITNLKDTGDPFYPLLSEKVDIMTSNTPYILLNNNRFVAFAKAQLSNENEPWSILKGKIGLADLIQPAADARTFGFGVLFVPILLLSLILMIFTKAPKLLWLLCIVAILPIAFFSQGWWARYIPTPWAIVSFSLISYYIYPHRKRLRTIYVILITMIAYTVVVALGRNAARRIHAHFDEVIIEETRNFKKYKE